MADTPADRSTSTSEPSPADRSALTAGGER